MKWIRAKLFNVGKWSGGTTTELIIYPQSSSYGERNFDFRLSTATVETDYSEFTPLPGIRRTLMVLSGSMKLEHEDQHLVNLKPFDFDIFDGGWTTKSYGKCTDFNLMCRGNTNGSLHHFSLMKNALKTFEFHGDQNFIYVVSGTVQCGEEQFEVGDLIIPETRKLTLQGIYHSELILVEVHS